MPVLARTARTLAAALSLWALVPDAALAQGTTRPAATTAVAPGARVRVTLRDDDGSGRRRQVGTVVALTPDTLVARWASGDTIAVPLHRLTRLEVSRGLRRRAGRGAALGFVGGAVVGAVWGAATYEGCQPQEPCIDFAGSDASSAAAGALVVGAAGALVGAVVGAQLRTEGWRAVPVTRVGVGAPPTGRRGALAVAVRF